MVGAATSYSKKARVNHHPMNGYYTCDEKLTDGLDKYADSEINTDEPTDENDRFDF